jgi:hypothetical protein
VSCQPEGVTHGLSSAIKNAKHGNQNWFLSPVPQVIIALHELLMSAAFGVTNPNLQVAGTQWAIAQKACKRLPHLTSTVAPAFKFGCRSMMLHVFFSARIDAAKNINANKATIFGIEMPCGAMVISPSAQCHGAII